MTAGKSKEQPDPKSWSDTLIRLGCGALAAVILVLDLMIPLGAAMAVSYLVVILLSLWSSRKKFTIWVGFACSAFTVAVFFYQPVGDVLWKIIFNRAMALFAIWATVFIGLQHKKEQQGREKAFREREKALTDLRILRGLLPICASCKRIRDGQGNWSQIEAYIKVHSEADFSHSICPECAHKLYPEYSRKIGNYEGE